LETRGPARNQPQSHVVSTRSVPGTHLPLQHNPTRNGFCSSIFWAGRLQTVGVSSPAPPSAPPAPLLPAFGSQNSGFRFRVSDFGTRDPGFGFRDPGFGFRVSTARVSGFGFRQFRVSGLERSTECSPRAYFPVSGFGFSGFGLRSSVFRVGLGFEFPGFGFRVSGSGVQGSGLVSEFQGFRFRVSGCRVGFGIRASGCRSAPERNPRAPVKSNRIKMYQVAATPLHGHPEKLRGSAAPPPTPPAGFGFSDFEFWCM